MCCLFRLLYSLFECRPTTGSSAFGLIYTALVKPSRKGRDYGDLPSRLAASRASMYRAVCCKTSINLSIKRVSEQVWICRAACAFSYNSLYSSSSLCLRFCRSSSAAVFVASGVHSEGLSLLLLASHRSSPVSIALVPVVFKPNAHQ